MNTSNRGRTKALAIVLALSMLLLLSGCSLIESVFSPKQEEMALEDSADETAGFRRTVLYFETDSGLMVPVMKLLPWEEGIGRAALNQLVDTETNKISASAMGLKNVVPPGVSFVLSISNEAVATVNIEKLPKLADAAAEQNLVTAVVNTLTEFPSIEHVTLQFDGQSKKKLPHGTPVNAVFSARPLNQEPLPVNAAAGEKQYNLTLYYPNRAASLYIPVTRVVKSEPDLSLAMQELVKGPVDASLRNCFPAGTQVLSATVLDGVAVINLSKEFASIKDSPDLETAALESMQLTAKQYGGATALHVQVEGADYESKALTTMAMPVYANEYR